jgi:hypothetical protein
MNTSIKQLSSGYEVEVRAVPPSAYTDVELQYNRDNPPPKKPTIQVKSVAGHTEELLAGMNTPEWAEYDRATELYKQELQAVFIGFVYNYAVVKWRKIFAPEETKEGSSRLGLWQSNPDMEWLPDPLYPDKTSPRRVLFIKQELLASQTDQKAILNPFATAPLAEEEISIALDKFPTDTEPATAITSARKRKGHIK